MAESLVVNGVTYPDVESVSMTNVSGDQVVFSLGGGGDEIVASIISRTITEWVDDKTTRIGAYAFAQCYDLEVVDCPNATIVQIYGFYNCGSLSHVTLQSAKTIARSAFEDCEWLERVDCHALTKIATKAFAGVWGDPAALIIRTPSVCTLDNVDAFADSTWEGGGGYVYVPSALVGSYKAATNWSAYASIIRAIEDYPNITGG